MPRTFLFAGGGSGGHISPGLAVAERLLEHDPNTQCHFICSDRTIDRTMLNNAGVTFQTMPARGLGRSPQSVVRWYKGYRNTIKCMRDVFENRTVDMVLTLGGYVAAPVAAAAASQHIPLMLLNLDRVPGKANRRIAARTENRFTAVPLVHPKKGWNVIGMPIRRSAIASMPAAECRSTLGLDPNRNVLLLTGASQGARTLNTVMPRIASERTGVFADWQVLHLCGDTDMVEPLRAQWSKSGVDAKVIGFLHAMGLAWGAADACVSRAGASSVAEAHANAVPTIFLPYPFHRDDHQRFNAEPLVALGGAALVTDEIDPDRTAATLGDALETMMQSPQLRQQMQRALRNEAWVDAASDVARHLLGGMSENSHAKG
jgi:UDP-N-acetylglucosamine--N-acetylmuramyl-(pentapeptide) pyrophosphoryl-undecaprenol N-acetylglucosamine transferase